MSIDIKKTILEAEDNDSNYLLVYTILKKEYNIIRANNGQEAVNITLDPSSHIDIILMDMKMPILDGLNATIIIRKENAKIPILALTAHAFDNDKKIALNAKCNDFIVKPVDITC